MNLNSLYKIIKDRQKNMPLGSYTTSLFKEGRDRIIQKVGEEAVETVIAAKNSNKNLIISETTDLFFHLLVMMVFLNITLKDINEELKKRHKPIK